MANLNPKLTLSRFVIHTRQFSIFVLVSVVIINLPVIFGSTEIRPLMIDVTAIAGAIVTVFVFFTITLMKHVNKQHAEGFLAFLIGTLLWLAAEFTFGYYREGLGVEVPYPSFADLFWLLGYGFFLFHNYNVISKLREVLAIDRTLIVLVSAAVGLTLGYILNLTFGVAEILSSTTDSLSFGVSVFYPIIDGIILIPAMIIFWSLRKGDPSHMHWLLMSASFVMVTIGDIGFGYSFALSPEVAGEYEWIWSIFFNTCYVCMAAGGIWFYIISRRNNVEDNPTNKTLNTSTL